MQRILVWPLALRLFHGLLAGMVLGAWLTRQHAGAALGMFWGSWHERFGYMAVVLVLARLVWGMSSRNVLLRFDGFVCSPGALWAYLHQLFRGRAPRYLGHNPLGGWMIVFLLAIIVLLALTGWLYGLDRFWGYSELATLHQSLGFLLIAAVGLHVLGGIYSSYAHRENLIAAMLHGYKRAEPDEESGKH
jgi:cytochrome b